MKRKYLILVVILVLSLLLAVGCNKGGDNNDPTPTKEPEVTSTPEPEETEEPTPTPEPGPQTYDELDFSDDVEGEMALLEWWNFWDVAGENKSVVKAEDDNQYLYIAGFISMTYMDLMSEEYSFQFDAKGTYSGEVAAAFIRGWGELTFPVPKNPNGCGYFEDDGTPTKFTSTTGIGLWFKENGKLTLFVKTNDSSQEAGIGNIFAEIECSYDETKWNRIRIDDDFKGTIKYYVNDELMAIVEYSELGEYDTFEGEKFYKKVTIKDAEGNQLATTDSAYVYESSEIAYGMRAASLNVDNIIIKTLEVEEE